MLLALLFPVLLLISSQFVQASLPNRRECRLELEKVVAFPANRAFLYLQHISLELKTESPLFWTYQNASVIDTFEKQYGVHIQIYNAFGIVTKYTYNTYEEAANNGIIGAKRNDDVPTARANVYGEGFSYNTSDFIYKFIIWNEAGEMFYVKIILSKEMAPMIC